MDSHDLKRQMKKIKALEKKNRIQEASMLASDLALVFPNSFDIQFMAGKLMHDIGEIDTGAFHLELASANFVKDINGHISFTDLSAVMGLLARCAKMAAAKAVWARNIKDVNAKNIDLDAAKQIVDVLTVLEMHDESLQLLNTCYQNFDNEKEFTELLIMMARIFHATDDIKSEFEVFELALKSDPINERLHNKVANFLSRIKAYDLASDHIKFIQTLNPEYKYKSIAQDFFAVSKSGSFEEQERIKDYWLANPDEPQDSKAPFATLLLTDDPAFLYEDVLQFADWTQLIKGKKRRTKRLPPIKAPQNRKIRVGYVSPDFRNHAVCHLVTDLIGAHNREEFEIYGYGISYFDHSVYREQIISKFDHFKSLESSNTQQVVQAIESDDLDICIDLCGYTTGMLGTLFNRLNGPIIVNYLGFPGTLGHPQYDYIIGDPIVTPSSTDKFFSEQVIRLDCCYQANSPSRPVTSVAFEETGLPSDCFVFCNFNTRQKLNRETLKIWEKIILKCENGVLWLLDPGEAMKKELLKEISSIQDRLFFAPMTDIAQHLGRVKHANLFLDSFPYGAHTTASDAVFSGIPVLAKSGRSFQSRVAWSIIHHAGLPEFKADCWESFAEKATDFYRSYTVEKGDRLKTFLQDFSRDRHPYNIEWTTREIERSFKNMLAST